MVITDVPFDARDRARNNRYSFIRRPDSAAKGITAAEDDDEEASANKSKEYASFLK